MTANIQNGGLVLRVEDRLLLMDNKEFSGTKLLREDAESGRWAAETFTDDLLWDMNADGDSVYYSDQRNRHAVYRLELRTNRKELLIDKPCCQLRLQGGWLYYIEESSERLYRSRLDGKGEQPVAEDKVWSYVCSNDRIYYATPRGIQTCDMSGSRHEKVTDATGYMLIEVGDLLAFPNHHRDGTLTFVAKDGSDAAEIGAIQTASLNTDGEYVYCSNALNNRSIYRVDPVSLRSIRISGDSADYLHLIGQALYYCSGREWHRLPLGGGEACRIG
ncbi:DUF5050 domain-containing protein [Paenibacillus soyae]|uniref:DUF5050 domain-containing protein n=1 Tax=Paenibacillus soyae TaxID=2969249 RepID=A0A9X2MPD7_9BACL|nr:DUF5050 domain-containing protein [Paenibacillus soyae]MCR2803401.1 DUF5050 domain-containing protein [Paenibacillus soyae]